MPDRPSHQPARTSRPSTHPPIHATNAWNPTGRNLQPVSGTRLYYAYIDGVAGERTYVFLGTQQHLTFVADLPGHHEPQTLRETVVTDCAIYPHLIDEA